MCERFTLEGFTYFQQGRKCSRVGCKCERGELHGPYWYKRDTSGKVQYIGRNLPQEIESARFWHSMLLGDMRRARVALATGVEALERLARGEALSDGDKRIIEALNLGAALVSWPDNQVTQDNQSEVVRLCAAVVGSNTSNGGGNA